MFLFRRPDGPAHSANLLLSYCYRTRSAILGLCGRNLDALEAARLGLDFARRSEDHKLVADTRRLVSGMEQEVSKEEKEMEEEGEDDNDEGEGGD